MKNKIRQLVSLGKSKRLRSKEFNTRYRYLLLKQLFEITGCQTNWNNTNTVNEGKERIVYFFDTGVAKINLKHQYLLIIHLVV